MKFHHSLKEMANSAPIEELHNGSGTCLSSQNQARPIQAGEKAGRLNLAKTRKGWLLIWDGLMDMLPTGLLEARLKRRIRAQQTRKNTGLPLRYATVSWKRFRT